MASYNSNQIPAIDFNSQDEIMRLIISYMACILNSPLRGRSEPFTPGTSDELVTAFAHYLDCTMAEMEASPEYLYPVLDWDLMLLRNMKSHLVGLFNLGIDFNQHRLVPYLYHCHRRIHDLLTRVDQANCFDIGASAHATPTAVTEPAALFSYAHNDLFGIGTWSQGHPGASTMIHQASPAVTNPSSSVTAVSAPRSIISASGLYGQDAASSSSAATIAPSMAVQVSEVSTEKDPSPPTTARHLHRPDSATHVMRNFC